MKRLPVVNLSNAAATLLAKLHPNVATEPVVRVDTISVDADAGMSTEVDRTVLSIILTEIFTPLPWRARPNDAQGKSFVQGLVSLPPAPEKKKKKEGRKEGKNSTKNKLVDARNISVNTMHTGKYVL
jgi:hypothetical protein